MTYDEKVEIIFLLYFCLLLDRSCGTGNPLLESRLSIAERAPTTVAGCNHDLTRLRALTHTLTEAKGFAVRFFKIGNRSHFRLYVAPKIWRTKAPRLVCSGLLPVILFDWRFVTAIKPVLMGKQTVLLE